MRGRRAHQLDPALRVGLLEGPEGIPSEPAEALDRAGVVRGLRLGGRAQGRAGVRDVAVGRVDPVPAEEAEHSLPHAFGLELVGEHRGHRHRQPLGDVEDRQVGAGEGIEEPLLTERVGPEALDVGHVRVQDDREVADGPPSLRDVSP